MTLLLFKNYDRRADRRSHRSRIQGRDHETPGHVGQIEDVDGVVTWVSPKERMKGKRTHHMPLSAEAVALLGKRRADDQPLFDVSSQNALLGTLQSNGGNGYTVHGFRSSVSDWVIDQTSYGADIANMCTAHPTRGKVRAAYQRFPAIAETSRDHAVLYFCTTPH